MVRLRVIIGGFRYVTVAKGRFPCVFASGVGLLSLVNVGRFRFVVVVLFVLRLVVRGRSICLRSIMWRRRTAFSLWNFCPQGVRGDVFGIFRPGNVPGRLFPSVLLVHLFRLGRKGLSRGVSTLFRLTKLSYFLGRVAGSRVERRVPPFHRFFRVRSQSNANGHSVVVHFVRMCPFSPILFEPGVGRSI